MTENVADTSGELFVGPAGWSYPDWDRIVYPHPKPAKFDALAYVARYFTAVEVNTSFYRPPPARMTADWVRRVEAAERFLFVFKLHQLFTHDRRHYERSDIKAFCVGLAPPAEANRLGCVLMQFPWSFRYNRSSLDWLERLADDFGAYPLAVEVRHDSWDVADAREALRRMRVGYCNIDQPALSHCLAPSAHVTSDVGYVRFHGRRTDTWFADEAAAHERYDYLYSQAQLNEWVPRIAKIARQAQRVFVFANNHYRGQGPANALQLRALLEGGSVAVPPPMRLHFPELAELAPGAGSGEKRFPPTLFELQGPITKG